MKKLNYALAIPFAVASIMAINNVQHYSPLRANASAIQIDTNDKTYEDKRNELIIDPKIKNKITSVKHTGGNAPDVLTNDYNGDEISSLPVGSSPDTNDVKGVTIAYWKDKTTINSNTKFEFNYDKVGTYQGHNISAKIEFYNIKPLSSDFFKDAFIYNQGSQNHEITRKLKNKEVKSTNDFKNLFTQGIWSRNIRSFVMLMHFYDENGTELSLDGNSYMTFNSMNPTWTSDLTEPGEFVHYSKMGSNPYYTRKDTVLEEYNLATTNGQNAVGGTRYSSPAITDMDASAIEWGQHHDRLGDPDFTKASVSFKINGKSNSFLTGNHRGLTQRWMTFSSATLWKVKPEDPTKNVSDDTGKDINKSEIKLGQTMTYDIDQKLSTMGQDNLSVYTSMKYTDKLDKRLKFKDATLTDSLGNKYDLATSGDLNVDSNNVLTYTLKPEFLKTLSYVGQKLKLTIHATVANIDTNDEIKNKANVNIENNSSTTNEVENEVPTTKPSLNKTVSDENGNDIANKDLKLGQTYYYTLKGKFNNDSMKIRGLKDDLDDRLDLKDVQIFDKDGNNVTSQGKLIKNDDNESFDWKANEPDKFSNQEISAKIKFTLNETKPLTDSQVKNIGHIYGTTDDDKNKDTPSNEVINEISKIDPKAIKSLKDDKNNDVDSHGLKIGQTYHYNVESQFDNYHTTVTRNISDDLDDVLDISSVVIKDETGKDITNQGKLVIDNSKESYVWTPNDSKLFVGKKVYTTIYFKLKSDNVPYDKIVKNIAHIGYDDNDKPSNEVDVGVAQGAPVNVHYVDQYGNKLANDDKLTGLKGDAWTTHQKNIPDYSISKLPNNPTGVFTDKNQDVTYVYTRIPGATVIVRYVDIDGKTLVPQEQLPNKYLGDKYSTSPKNIDHYKLIKTPDNAEGVYTRQEQVVTYVYDRVQGGDVLTHHLEVRSNIPLVADVSQSGKYGLSFTTKPITIAKYHLVQKPKVENGTFTDDVQEFTYYYLKNDGGKVTIHYVDTDGNKIAGDEVITGKIDDQYQVKPKDIDSYILVKSPEHTLVTLTDKEQELTYVYDKAPAEVEIHYVDKNGKELAQSEHLDGKIDDDYKTSAQQILNYSLIETPSNANGKYTKDKQVVTYVYAPINASNTVDGHKPDAPKPEPEEPTVPKQDEPSISKPNESSSKSSSTPSEQTQNIPSQKEQTKPKQAIQSPSKIIDKLANTAQKEVQKNPAGILAIILTSLVAIIGSITFFNKNKKEN